MPGYCKIREDLDQQNLIPGTLKGFPEWDVFPDKFRYAYLEEDTPEGYNVVIWLPTEDFVDLANSIDFDFIMEGIEGGY